ncbi:MAG TPA: Hsp20/alpha crystallin family protein, partial [Candidatus Thermoplasmatota archaeon]|nr:Hsp20/alpha crystallin family protein [Candidatus Thermoplasmatota archaeon]
RSGPPQWSWANARTPRVDLRDLGSTYEVVAELPGIPKDKVQLSVEGSRMEIRAEHAEPTEARVSGEPRKAADRIAYYRSLALPVDADPQGVKAVMRDGILHVTLPKSTGKDKPGRKVKVE